MTFLFPSFLSQTVMINPDIGSFLFTHFKIDLLCPLFTLNRFIIYDTHVCTGQVLKAFKCSLSGNCKHKLIPAGASDCFFYFNFFSEKQISLAWLKCFEINQVLPGNNRDRSEFVFWKGFHNLHNLIFVSCSVHFGADVPGVFVAPHSTSYLWPLFESEFYSSA